MQGNILPPYNGNSFDSPSVFPSSKCVMHLMQNGYDESKKLAEQKLLEGRETDKYTIKLWDINTQLLTDQAPKTVKIKDLRTSLISLTQQM